MVNAVLDYQQFTKRMAAAELAFLPVTFVSLIA
jgi:hypothetical protein